MTAFGLVLFLCFLCCLVRMGCCSCWQQRASSSLTPKSLSVDTLDDLAQIFGIRDATSQPFEKVDEEDEPASSSSSQKEVDATMYWSASLDLEFKERSGLSLGIDNVTLLEELLVRWPNCRRFQIVIHEWMASRMSKALADFGDVIEHTLIPSNEDIAEQGLELLVPFSFGAVFFQMRESHPENLQLLEKLWPLVTRGGILVGISRHLNPSSPLPSAPSRSWDDDVFKSELELAPSKLDRGQYTNRMLPQDAKQLPIPSRFKKKPQGIKNEDASNGALTSAVEEFTLREHKMIADCSLASNRWAWVMRKKTLQELERDAQLSTTDLFNFYDQKSVFGLLRWVLGTTALLVVIGKYFLK